MKHPKINLELKKHLNKERENANVLGMIITEGKKFKNSIVLYIVLGNNEHTRIKTDFYLHKIFVEYHKNPFKQIRHNFKKELKDDKFETAEIFADCKILYKKGRKLEFLIKEAKLILKKKKK